MADDGRSKPSNCVQPGYVGSGIVLKKHQIEHFDNINKILEGSFSYVDTSPMGSGKTIIALSVAHNYGLSVYVVCPKSAVSMWESEAKKYNIRMVGAITYQTLTGTKTRGCSHGLLDRDETSFYPTKYLSHIIKEGTLFIFDEMHSLKNVRADCGKAAHAIVKEVVRFNAGSRIALLSATPFDKEEHAQNLLKMIGIVIDDNYYFYDKTYNYYEPLGINEVIDWCDKVDPEASRSIHEGIIINNKTVATMCYEFLTNIVKDVCFSSMPPPKIESDKDAMNGYYRMPEKDVVDLQNGIDALSRAVSFNERTQTVNINPEGFGGITKALVRIEDAKINTMIRLAREKLNDDDNCKVILYVWYVDSIKKIQRELRDFNPMAMYGETSPIQRDAIIERFQRDSNDYRLLISNSKVGGVGINLDDRSGNHPRHMFMIPSYNFIDLHQATGRIHRTTTMSKASIRFIYSEACRNETSILNALARKTAVTKSVLTRPEGIIFPGEYEEYVETFFVPS